MDPKIEAKTNEPDRELKRQGVGVWLITLAAIGAMAGVGGAVGCMGDLGDAIKLDTAPEMHGVIGSDPVSVNDYPFQRERFVQLTRVAVEESDARWERKQELVAFLNSLAADTLGSAGGVIPGPLGAAILPALAGGAAFFGGRATKTNRAAMAAKESREIGKMEGRAEAEAKQAKPENATT